MHIGVPMFEFPGADDGKIDFGPSEPERMLAAMFERNVPIMADDREFLPAWEYFEKNAVQKLPPERQAQFGDLLKRTLESLTRLGPDTARARTRVQDMMTRYPGTPAPE